MWAIRNETRYAAERSFVRNRDGAELWIVVVRATFDIKREGPPEPAAIQPAVVRAPLFIGAPATTSLRYDSDFVRTKLGTDVVLHGCAYAPGRRPAERVDVSVLIGNISKSLVVHGQRRWQARSGGLVPGPALPFLFKTIDYEAALGGPLADGESAPRDPANPSGVGRIARAGAQAPSIELRDDPVASPTSANGPAGLGPIPCHWLARARLAGTYDAAWQRDRQPLVPDDFQDTYFQCAPTDQRAPGFLRGGEQVILRNLTPDGELRFQLPRLSIGFRTRIAGSTVDHRGQLHTVIIEPDTLRLIMVWHTALPCHHTLYTLKETVVFEKERIAGEGARTRREPLSAT